MIGQQRHILATLGIDVWIPRKVSCQKNTAPSLWRDQTVDEIVITPPMQFEVTPQPEQQIESIPSTIIQEKIQPDVAELIGRSQIAPTIVTSIPDQAPIIEKEAVVVRSSVQAFELQMYVLENCAILLESSQLSERQQQLWANIQRAKSGQYTELKWPFPLADFQDSRGLAAYIQGFLDVTATHKKILCLGQLNFIQHPNILTLASLDEMLAQPLLKKRLWQLMQ